MLFCFEENVRIIHQIIHNKSFQQNQEKYVIYLQLPIQ